MLIIKYFQIKRSGQYVAYLMIMRTKTKIKGYFTIMLVMGITALIFLWGAFSLVKSFSQKTNLDYRLSTQAMNVSRSGVQDAIGWFRRQTLQPVAVTNRDANVFTFPDSVFQPLYNVLPSMSDTMTPEDEAIGLVKEFELSPESKIWGRYEIKRQHTAYQDSLDPLYIPDAVHDVTASRIPGRSTGEGLAWQIFCKGYVYRKIDPQARFNEKPNKILSVAQSSAEIRRIALSVPTAAVILNDRNQLTLKNDADIQGGSGAGFGFFDDSGSPTLTGSGFDISGALGAEVDLVAPGPISPANFFDAPESVLRLVSDRVERNVVDLGPYPTMALVFINGNAIFNESDPLEGGGLLYVNGNLTISEAANFNGLIYVAGNAAIYGPAVIRGALVVGGTLLLDGTSDNVTIEYQEPVLDQIRRSLMSYREIKSVALEGKVQ
ncbi:MAG: hypothetical protein KCHDKBKB_02727 [Elusimicrobia bacterium]|nr:hypothetical protein [Elusimicrobiota bacterium]